MELLDSLLHAFISKDTSSIVVANVTNPLEFTPSFSDCYSFWNSIPGTSVGYFKKSDILITSVRPTILLEIDYASSVDAGDTFAIFAPNDDMLVSNLISLLGFPLDVQIYKKTILKSVPFGTSPAFVEFSKGGISISLSNLLKFVLEIKNPALFLKKTFLSSLSRYMAPGEKQKFVEAISLPGKESSSYYNKLLSTRVDLFTFLSWIYLDDTNAINNRMPIDELIDFLSPISARQYSLVWNNYDCKSFSILFNKEERGHCTNWLSFLCAPGLMIPFIHRKATIFTPPKDHSANVIMIAHGTGIAPFLSFLQAFCNNVNYNNRTIWLIYGCRDSDNFLFKSQVDEFLRKGVLTKLSVCYSRPLNGSSYTSEYVQDIVLKENSLFQKMMLEPFSPVSSSIYICGDQLKMVPEVLSALSSSIEDVPNNISGEFLIKEWVSKGRILREIWL